MQTKHYVLALIPLSLAGIALRVRQLFKGVEPDTLFYVPDAVCNLIFGIFLGVCLLLFLSALFLLHKEKKSLSRAMVSIRGAEKTVILLYAVLCLSSELFDFYGDVILTETPFPEAVLSLTSLRVVLAILLITFISAYVSAPKAFSAGMGFRILSLSLCAYYIACLFDSFVSESLIMLSYKGLHILFYSAATLFFFSFSKALSGMYARKSLFAFGCCTAFLGTVRIGNAVAAIISQGEYPLGDSVLHFLADVLLIATVLIIMSKPMIRRRKKDKDEKAPAQA